MLMSYFSAPAKNTTNLKHIRGFETNGVTSLTQSALRLKTSQFKIYISCPFVLFFTIFHYWRI